MQGKTHRVLGTAFTLAGFEVMRHKGLLIPDINPILQLAIMYPIAQWSSTIPDLDHHWASTPSKTPVNKVVHFLLHLSRPRHRSWQTHSVLVSGGFLFLLYSLVMLGNELWSSASSTDWLLMRLMIWGFILGYLSHLFGDSINPSGIHLYPGFKIKFVPKTSFFATGGTWETMIIYPLCLVVSGVFAISALFGLFSISLYDQIVLFIQR